MSLDQKNLHAIQTALNAIYKKQEASDQKIAMLEATVVTLRAELAGQKQLTAHVLGRGMGSTTNGNNS